MGLFSGVKCVHFVGGDTPRCSRGFILTSVQRHEDASLPMVLIEEGCDEFKVSMRSVSEKTGQRVPR